MGDGEVDGDEDEDGNESEGAGADDEGRWRGKEACSLAFELLGLVLFLAHPSRALL